MRRTLLPLLILIVAGVVWLLGQQDSAIESQAADNRAARPASARDAAPAIETQAPAGRSAAMRAPIEAAPDAPAQAASVDDPSWGKLSIVVLDKESGEPVPGIEVLPYPSLDDRESHVRFLRFMEARGWGDVDINEDGEPMFGYDNFSLPSTGTDGRLTIPILPHVEFEVTAYDVDDAAGYEVRAMEAMREGEHRSVEFFIAVGDDMRIRLRVTDAETRLPIVNAAAFLYEGDYEPRRRYPVHSREAIESLVEVFRMPPALSEPDGIATFRAPSYRRKTALVHAVGYGVRTTTLIDDDDRGGEPLEVRLFEAARMSGRLSLPATDLDSWTLALTCAPYMVAEQGPIQLHGRLAWSQRLATDGLYRLEELPPHVSLQVELIPPADDPLPLADTIQLAPGEDRVHDFILSAPGKITGTVVDTEGKPVWGVNVALMKPSGFDRNIADGQALQLQEYVSSTITETSSDRDGSFAFDDIPSGRWKVGVKADDDSLNEQVSPSGMLLTLPESVPTAEVTLTVHRGHYIRGHVLSVSGEPLYNVSVHSYGLDVFGTRITQSKPDGTFRLGPLHPGSYRVGALSNDRTLRFEDVVADADDQDVEMRAQAAGELVVNVKTASGVAASRATVRIVPQDTGTQQIRWSSDTGQCSFDAMPPGAYDIFATSQAGEAGFMRNVQAIAGQRTVLPDLMLAGGAKLEFQFEDLGFDPVRVEVHQQGFMVWVDQMRTEQSVSAVVLPGPGVVYARPTEMGTSQLIVREFDAAPGGQTTIVISRDS